LSLVTVFDVSRTGPPIVTADPDDDIFLLCAVEAQAEYIVTADRHLLNLGSYLTVDIITVQEFFELGLHNNAERDS
jgi:predicted nucleic acid-binding protein